jgi:hypothetical protein
VVRQPPYVTEYTSPSPGVVTVPSATPVAPARNDTIVAVSSQQDALFARLKDANETVRRDAAMDLGRAKSERALDSLIPLLAKDPSPIVRDAAARALGLIASPRCLSALTYAAQADPDRDVRHSAQFAIEIIRTNLRGN